MKFAEYLSRGAKNIKETAKYAGGFFAGGVGYQTGIYQFFANAKEMNPVKAFGKSFLTSSVHSNVLMAPLNLAPKMVQHADDAKGLVPYKLSPLGAGLLMGAAAYNAAEGAYEQDMVRGMGQITPGIQAAPVLTYDFSDLNENNTGASGDLVFALNKLRRG